ncbi:glutathione S-transferase L1-like [Salvia splendens]|uniref:glutathione S-transferase L1-like n=1 Tax=Salvia splendens TaxID=180675 RepID=UPI001C26759E|nr:glutathione S-transferase L1-like [Salvia splendens]
MVFEQRKSNHKSINDYEPQWQLIELDLNGHCKGESLDLIRYNDQNIEGPSLFPNGPTQGEFGEKLLSVTGSFHKAVTTSLKENRIDEASAAFDEIDSALSNFDDGLFFLGQLSLVRNYAILIL